MRMGALYSFQYNIVTNPEFQCFLLKSQPAILVARFLSIGMLNCCTPTINTMRMYVCIRYTPAVCRIICMYRKKYMQAGKYNSRIGSFLPESTYHTGCWRHNKKPGTWPRLNFLLEKGGALPTNSTVVSSSKNTP